MTTSQRIMPFGILAILLFSITACLSENPPASCDGSEDAPTLSTTQGPEQDRCDPPPPPEPCPDCPGLHGDPHLRTFDDHRYDVQAAGELTLVVADDLEVQARMEPVGTRVSVATAVAMSVDGDQFTVTMDPTSPDGYVARRDGRTVELSDDFPVLVGDGRAALTDDNEIVVEWGDGSRVTVVVQSTSLSLVAELVPARRESADGLLGTANSDRTDDVRTRDGQTFATTPDYDTLYGVVVESWRVSDESSLFDYEDRESTQTFTDRSFPGRLLTLADLSPEARSEAEQVCRAAGVTDQAILDGCILDVATTGDASFAEVAADMQRRLALGSDGDVDKDERPGKVDKGEAVRWLTQLDGLKTTEPGEVLDGEGHVLVHTWDDENDEGVLVALDATNGSEVWRVNGVDTRCPAVPLGSGRIAVVGQVGGRLGDPDIRTASLAILDASDGSMPGSPGFAAEDQPGFTNCRYSAHNVGTTVAYTDGRTVWGWDASADSPELAWTYQRRNGGMNEVVVADGRILWVGYADDRSGIDGVLLDPRTGAVQDQVTIPGRVIEGSAAAIVVSRSAPAMVVVTTREHQSDSGVAATLVGLRVDGERLSVAWTREGRSDDDDGPDLLRSLTIDDDIVIGHAGGELYAFSLDDGSPSWVYDPPGFRNTAAPGVVGPGGVFLDGIFGGPFLIAVGPDGEPVDEYVHTDLFGDDNDIFSAATFGPVIADSDIVIVGTNDGDGRPVVAALSLPGKRP